MQLSNETKEFIKKAPCRALATDGEAGLNVIPVSMVLVEDDHLVICDCFMQKTRQNAMSGGSAALALWDGLEGVQIKGTISYETEGDGFEKHTQWLSEQHPDRKLCGIVIFTPTEEHDLAPKVRD